jgi:hypothetical protein
MLNRNMSRKMWSTALIALAGIVLCALPQKSIAQAQSPGEPPSGLTSSDSSWNKSYNPVYDLSPAMARSSFADSQLDSAYADWSNAILRARMAFENSADYRAAQQELADALSQYNAAKQVAIASVANDATYRDLLQKRTETDVAMTSATTGAERIQLAQEKMEYGAAISQMEATAMAKDSAVQSARTRLITAQQSLDAKITAFNVSVSDIPAVASAAKNLQIARANQAAASSALTGAWIARNDTVDADYRRYPPGPYVANYSTPFSPYYSGYYGLGGFSYGIIR